MPRLKWLDVCGLRSFGLQQSLAFEQPLALIWGGNSQGKTSIAEAIEFLLTGTIVRRVMLGGAKNEYDHSLRNVYHPAGDKVLVRAGIEDADGNVHTVERELICDFERNQDCQSRLIIDNVEAADLSSIGIQLAEPPLRAPILFQHSIRYALSAAPSDRLTYFKALLEVSDLDLLADELKRVVDGLPLPPMPLEKDLAVCLGDDDLARVLDVLRDDAATSVALTNDRIDQGVRIGVERLAGAAPAPTVTVVEASDRLKAELESQEQRRFDLAAWRPGALPDWRGASLDACRDYSTLAAEVDAEAERLRTLFEAVLEMPSLRDLEEPTTCPICVDGNLTPARIAALREAVAGATELRDKQTAAQRELSGVRAAVAELESRAAALAPRAGKLSDKGLKRSMQGLAPSSGRT